MRLKLNRTLRAIAAGGLVTIGAATARANVVFASFQNAPFQFNDTGNPSTAGLFSATNATATFQFHETVTADAVTYTAGESISAKVELTTLVNGSASSATIGPETFDVQAVKDGTLEFLDPSGNNLLTISNFTGTISGLDGGNTANLETDTILSVDPDTGTYSSDFLTFAPPTDVVASTAMTLNGEDQIGIDSDTGNFNAFSANADGSFSGNVPEPSALGLMGLCSIALLHRRPRRA